MSMIQSMKRVLGSVTKQITLTWKNERRLHESNFCNMFCFYSTLYWPPSLTADYSAQMCCFYTSLKFNIYTKWVFLNMSKLLIQDIMWICLWTQSFSIHPSYSCLPWIQSWGWTGKTPLLFTYCHLLQQSCHEWIVFCHSYGRAVAGLYLICM